MYDTTLDLLINRMCQYRKLAESGQDSLFGGFEVPRESRENILRVAMEEGFVDACDDCTVEQHFDRCLHVYCSALALEPRLQRIGYTPYAEEFRALSAFLQSATLHSQEAAMTIPQKAAYDAALSTLLPYLRALHGVMCPHEWTFFIRPSDAYCKRCGIPYAQYEEAHA